MRLTRRLLALSTCVLVTHLAVPASAAPTPTPGRTDSTWSEAYIPSGDGVTTLHADVLRPKGLSESAKTPVVMTVSPYTNHSNQAATDFDPTQSGPSHRFYDFLDQSRILSRGYTYVIVDLPGFGGSGGCNDWGGPVEQGAVKTAVEWAAKQPWSTGKVGLFGKSYDGWTGLMGLAQKPKGLAAVISMEPVYSGYRYLYSDGVRFTNSVSTDVLFQGIDAVPGSLNDSPQYQASGAPTPYCYASNVAQQSGIDDPTTDFWKARDLLPSAKGSHVPLFLTQGFLEDNTKPDGAFLYFDAYAGPKHAWLGQHEHVRGYDVINGRRANGRTQFVAEANRFLDHWLRGAPATGDPVVETQDNDGRWRAESAWPPADSKAYTSTLNTGTYTDDGQSNGSGGAAGTGVWSVSQPLQHDARYVGEAHVDVTVSAVVPRANLVADVYDIDAAGRGVLLGRAAHLMRGTGSETVDLRLYGQDWRVARGHRMGVLITSSNGEWYLHAPTQQPVTVSAASVTLPFLTKARTSFLKDGVSTPRLDAWKKSDGVATISEQVLGASARRFNLP